MLPPLLMLATKISGLAAMRGPGDAATRKARSAGFQRMKFRAALMARRCALAGLFGVAVGVASLLSGCSPPGTHAFLEGDRLLREGKYIQAIEKLKIATELIAENAQPRAWNHLGLAYQQAGRANDAIQAYQHALRLNPNLAVTHFNLGCLYLDQNNLPSAVSELNAYTVLENAHRVQDPKFVPAWLKLGTAYLRARQFDAAEKCYQTALQLNPSLPEALNGLGLIQIQRKHLREALTFFNAALEKRPDYGPALLNLAITYHPQNRQLALRKYREYLDLKPRPSEFSTVEEIIRQIEAELHPAPTNPPPALTNLARATGPATNGVATRPTTNAPAASIASTPSQPKAVPARISGPLERPIADLKATSAPTAKLESPASASNKTAAPAVQPPSGPKEEAPPKIEVVTLTNEAAPKLPEDIAPASPPPPTNVLVAAAPKSVPENLPPPAPLQSLGMKEKPKSVTRRVLDRLDPRSWFGRKSPSVTPAAPREAPDPRAISEPDHQPVRFVAPPALVLTPRPPPPPVPRYAYQSPTRPVPGDRAKAEVFFAQGLKAHRERRLTVAVEAYREAVKLDPTYFEAHFNLGLAAYDAKDLPQSLLAYERALAIDPDSADGRYNFALALERAGYYRDASNELEKLLSNRPDEARTHFALAKLYAERLAQIDAAREHYQRVLRLDPAHSEAAAIRYWLAAHP